MNSILVSLEGTTFKISEEIRIRMNFPKWHQLNLIEKRNLFL